MALSVSKSASHCGSKKSAEAVKGVIAITAELRKLNHPWARFLAEGSSMEILAQSESHGHRLGRLNAASDMQLSMDGEDAG